MQENFERHQAANQSRLEPWRSHIAEMRRLDWPYQKIAEWLAQHQRIAVSLQAVQQFCKVRGIKKGSAKKLPPPPRKGGVPSSPVRKAKSRTKKRFEYNEANQPIDLSKLNSQR